MAEVIEIALHARARRLLFLFLRRHGLDFFVLRRNGEAFSRVDERKVDLILRLADRDGDGDDDGSAFGRLQLESARSMVHRLLIRRLAVRMVENGY